jgi:ATP-dependent DNA helicase RecG
VTIPIHEGCDQSSEKSSGTSSETNSKSSEKGVLGSEKSSEKASKSSEKILDLIKNKPTISAAEIAMEIDMSARGVEKQIRKLREAGIIKRIGADRGGYWEITVTKEDK